MATLPAATLQLVKAVPEDQRSNLLTDLAKGLHVSFDSVSANLAVALASRNENLGEASVLSDAFLHRAQEGSADDVASVVSRSPALSRKILEGIISRLNKGVALPLQQASQSDPRSERPISTTQHDFPDDFRHSSQLLQLARRLVSTITTPELESRLMIQALTLIRGVDEKLALAARELAFTLLSTASAPLRSPSSDFEQCITSLLSAASSPFHKTLGYSLWLRQLTSPASVEFRAIDLRNTAYWEKIIDGLRYGDSERRKLSLEILKQSVRIAADEDGINSIAGVKHASPSIVAAQFGRFCTVFETLILARYTHLAVECEKDLQLLSSEKSVLESKWLFLLLSTALDPSMHDQTRKFIGTWILRNTLEAHDSTSEYAKILRDDFLPWITEGHTFVATVKQTEDGFRCHHGDLLSQFIRSLCQKNLENTVGLELLMDSIITFLLHRRAKLFAYAAVYILDGLAKASLRNDTLCLTQTHFESVLELSDWPSLPETAGYLVRDRCWAICNASETPSQESRIKSLSTIGRERYARLRDAIHATTAPATKPIPPAADVSQREAKVQQAVKKCADLRKNCMSQTPAIDGVLESLEDIWSDLEYLVYPRDLLFEIPFTFLNIDIVRLALGESEACGALRELLGRTVLRVIELVQKRSYLLPHLMSALRLAILAQPQAATSLHVEQVILQIAQDPPEPTIDIRFEYAAARLLEGTEQDAHGAVHERIFGKGETHGYALYIDLVSRLGNQQNIIESVQNTILARWRRQKTPAPSVSPWKTTLQLQVLLLCCEQSLASASPSSVQGVAGDLYYILSVEPLPRYRCLLAWTILRLHIHHPHLNEYLLKLMATKDHHSNPKYLASLMKLAVELASVDGTTEDFALQLAAAFIALSASSKVIIRHEAQWSFPFLMDLARSRGWHKIATNAAYVALDEYIRSLPRYDEPPLDRVQSRFHPIESHTFTNLAEGAWTNLDQTGPPYARRKDFESIYEEDDLQGCKDIQKSCMMLGDAMSITHRGPTPLNDDERQNQKPQTKQMTQEEAIALQTKGSAYLRTAHQDEAEQARSNELVVVASLITNPYNLGGLSRVSEIFAAQSLYVRDPRVIAEKDFTSVAVSSHNHIDIMPLSVPDMPTFLAERKLQGWKVVGVEQTDRSIVLGAQDAVLPRKTILVLGSEREGIPGVVLSECDLLVEIPQQGVTRSLNVQTAAAIALFEYSRQHAK